MPCLGSSRPDPQQQRPFSRTGELCQTLPAPRRRCLHRNGHVWRAGGTGMGDKACAGGGQSCTAPLWHVVLLGQGRRRCHVCPAGTGAAPAPTRCLCCSRRRRMQPPWQRPLSPRCRGPHCCGDGWLLAPACGAGAAQAPVAVGAGRFGHTAAPGPGRCVASGGCPALPAAARPTGSTATSPVAGRAVGLGLINAHSCFPV